MRAPRILSLCFVLICATILFVLSTQPAYAFSPIFVKPNGGGAGSSNFANATTLQHALSIAHPGDQIWVATGVYTPGLTVDDTFLLPHGVALYGGFALNTTQLSQRDWLAHPSVLSGDIEGNDDTDAHGIVTTTANIHGTNSLHVLTADGTISPITDTTRLDGFTVTAGDATPGANGGGLYCDGENGGACKPHIENVTFSGNKAQNGGAIFNISFHGVSSPSLVNVTFAGNTANVNGGALFDDGDNGISSPTLNNVTFISNTASVNGGAIYNNGNFGNSNPTLDHVTFSGNSAHEGGAIYNYGAGNHSTSSPTLLNVTFFGNRAVTATSIGGAMYNDGENGGHSSPALDNVTFSGNRAIWGGAVYNNGESGGHSSPSLLNVTFSANSAADGGALFNDGDQGASSPSLVNVTFSGNSSNKGGGMYNQGAEAHGVSSPSLLNVTFYSNTALFDGGAIFDGGLNGGVSSPSLVNVAFYSNTGYYGGGIDNEGIQGVSSPSLVNVTFYSNTAVNFGGAMMNYVSGNGASNPSLVNALLWDNTSPIGAQLYNYDATVFITTSLVQGGIGGAGVVNDHAVITDGGGNLNADPLFVDATHGNLRLRAGSPAIDAGTNSAITETTDLDGNPRKRDGDGNSTAIVDMGAYEAPPAHALAVTIVGNGQVLRAPVGASCSAPCSAIYQQGTSVTLTATAGNGFTFTGWKGAGCSGTGNCVMTMTSNKSVTATFTHVNTPGNDPPGFTSTPELAATVGILYSYSITTHDPDSGDTLTLSAPLTRPWLTLTPTGNGTATLTGTPGSGDVGANGVQFRVQDQVGAFATQSFTITVAAANPDTSGSVQGKVQEEQNKGLAGATLTLSNASGQAVAAALLTQTSNGSGNYLFEGVPVGNYTLSAAMAGHDSSTPQAVTVQAGKTTAVPPITLSTSKPLLHLPLLDRGQ